MVARFRRLIPIATWLAKLVAVVIVVGSFIWTLKWRHANRVMNFDRQGKAWVLGWSGWLEAGLYASLWVGGSLVVILSVLYIFFGRLIGVRGRNARPEWRDDYLWALISAVAATTVPTLLLGAATLLRLFTR